MYENIVVTIGNIAMSDENDQDKYLVPGLVRGLRILESFTEERREMTLSEISNILDINRSSAFRLVQTLEHCGYLNRTPHKTYSLNVKVLQLGYTAIESMTIPRHAVAIMQKLRDQTKVAVHLSMLDNIEIVYLTNVQAMGTFTSNIRVGTRWPAYATVIGQILLGSLTDEEIRERYRHLPEWIKYSASTSENIEELIEKVHHARNAPYLISWKNFKPDMIACAVPIHNKINQKTQYVLSVSCPATSYSNQKEFEKKVVPMVIEAANEISDFSIIQSS